MKNDPILSVLKTTIRRFPLLTAGLAAAAAGSIFFALLPPLVLEKIINRLAAAQPTPLSLALLYFLCLILSGLFDFLKEMSITVFGQKISHQIRHQMSCKLALLPASFYTGSDPGELTSRFVGDVDTLENLFGSGIIGMITDIFKVVSILAVIFYKSRGLGILMAAVTPLLFLFTRHVQKRMLTAQLKNRAAIAKVTGLVPESIRNIRMIRCFSKESYMENKYDDRILESYQAIEKTNFYDAIYSPVILVISAVIIGIMMMLSVTGGTMQTLFGMSVGTAVAVIAYVGKVFEPLENIGMEIQNIQSALAGVKRIRDFLQLPERSRPSLPLTAADITAAKAPAVCAEELCFHYSDQPDVLHDFSLTIQQGENIILTGRTGSGKSTLFKLLLGLYTPASGSLKIFGFPADQIPDQEKRRIFGCVEQSFHPVPGTIADQICVFDADISPEAMEKAALLTGIHEKILSLPQGYDTPYTDSLFSQGQRQLLSITRAVASDPSILLLDEITANLDSDTEERVLTALKNASEKRTVISISHRLYETGESRMISLT